MTPVSRRELDDYIPRYTNSSKYKYGKYSEPTFNGAETKFFEFSKNLLAFLRRRGIPNHFEEYFETRELREDLSREEIAADREIYDLFTSSLVGTATAHTDKHRDTCSGHLVWVDLIETFLQRSGPRRTQVQEELSATSWGGPRSGSLP